MRSVLRGILCAGLIAGFCGSAAAEGVRIWAPSPVKAVAHKARAAKTSVNVITVVVTDSRRRRLTRRDWALGSGAYGFTKVYSGPLYPF